MVQSRLLIPLDSWSRTTSQIPMDSWSRPASQSHWNVPHPSGEVRSISTLVFQTNLPIPRDWCSRQPSRFPWTVSPPPPVPSASYPGTNPVQPSFLQLETQNSHLDLENSMPWLLLFCSGCSYLGSSSLGFMFGSSRPIPAGRSSCSCSATISKVISSLPWMG